MFIFGVFFICWYKKKKKKKEKKQKKQENYWLAFLAFFTHHLKNLIEPPEIAMEKKKKTWLDVQSDELTQVL